MFLPSNHQRTPVSPARQVGRRPAPAPPPARSVPSATMSALLCALVVISSMELVVFPARSLQLQSQQPQQHHHQAASAQLQRRLLAADRIQLADGSTARVQSLEEYLAAGNSSTGPSVQPVAADARSLEVEGPAQAGPNSTPSRSDERPKQAAALRHQDESTQAERQQGAAAPALAAASSLASSSPQASSNGHQQQQQQQQQHNHQGGDHAMSHSENSSSPTGAPGGKPIPQHWQVKSLLNVTHDYPLAYSQIICGYVWPLMAAITLFTNLMIVFVLTQRDMRTPTNVVLTAIAIADIIPIVVPVPWFVYLFAMGNEKQVLYPPMACYFYQHSTRSISEIFYFLSTWLNVLLAIQDYLTACWPQAARRYCQIRVVVVEIVCLTLLAFLLNLPQALKLVFKPVRFYYNGQLTWGCKALQAKWFKDLVGEYVALYDDIFTAIIVLFVDGGPALLLITLTALLIRQLQQQRIKGHLLMEQARTASKRRRERHRQQEYEASARVMIFVLLAFLAVKIPFATTYTLMIIQSRFEIRFVDNLVDFQKAITLTDLVFVLSYPINFTIFCCCSKRFRHKCAQLLGDCNDSTRHARDRLWSSFSEQSATGHQLTSQSMDDPQQQQDVSKSSRLLNQFNSIHQQHQQQQPAYGRNRDDSLATIESIDEAGRLVAEGPAGGQYGAAAASAGRAEAGQQQQLQGYRIPVVGSCTVKSILDDGSLCLECIMRYEQMKKHSSTASGQVGPGRESQQHQSASQGHAAAVGGVQQQPQPQPQQADQMSSSKSSDEGDESSWLASGASASGSAGGLCQLRGPQLNLPYIQHQLPAIVTTRCESIRERDSGSSSADETANDDDGGPCGCAPQRQASGAGDEPAERPPGDAHATNEAEEEEEAAANDGDDHQERLVWDQRVVVDGANLGDSSVSMNEAHTQVNSTRRAGHLEQQQQQQQQRPGGGGGGNLLGGPKRGHSANRVASDPGPSVTRAAVAAAAGAAAGQLDERRASGGGGGGADRGCQQDSLSGSSSLAARLCRLGRQNLGPAEGRAARRNKHHKQQHHQKQGDPMQQPAPKRGLGSLLLSQIESRQRSLSLSNSNLSTLPNATGLLADIFVSALVDVSGSSRSAPPAGGGGPQQSRTMGERQQQRDEKEDETAEHRDQQPAESGEEAAGGDQVQDQDRAAGGLAND